MISKLIVKIGFFLIFFLFYLFIVSTNIDLPTDKKTLATLERMSFETIDPIWKNCTSYTNIPEYKDATPEDQEKLKGICFIKIELKDGRFFASALNLDTTLLQRKVCISGDSQYIPEQERADGTSVWDIRKYGQISNDGKCLFLENIDGLDYLPFKMHPGLVQNYLVRSLVHGYKAIFVVYLFSFLLAVYILKSLKELYLLLIQVIRW